MILKQLATQLRDRDWLSVVLEIGIVIVGILIALQLDNWNQERKAAAQADAWRAAIIQDLRATQRSLRGRINYYQQALDFAETALPAMLDREPVSTEEGWTIVLGAFQAGQIWPLRISGATYREVQAAGMLDLISSRTVMTKLINYYEVSAFDVDVISGDSPPYRDMIREKMAWSIQKHIWNSDCQSDAVNTDDGGFIFSLEHCAKPDLDSEILDAVNQFRSDTDLQNKLRGRMSQLMIVIASFSRQVRHIESIIHDLRSPISSPDLPN
jgi:hypothetical protein